MRVELLLERGEARVARAESLEPAFACDGVVETEVERAEGRNESRGLAIVGAASHGDVSFDERAEHGAGVARAVFEGAHERVALRESRGGALVFAEAPVSYTHLTLPTICSV